MANQIANWRNQKKEYPYLGKIGKLISFTKIHNPPKGHGRTPYWVGLVEFKDGHKKTGQLVVEGKEPKIGSQVEGVIRIIGEGREEEIINYGIKFKLL